MNDGRKALPGDLTRRQALMTATLGAAAVALPGCVTDHEPSHTEAPNMSPSTSPSSTRLPVVYLPHGGGPWPFAEVGFTDRSEREQLAAYLRALPALPQVKPQAVLVISAHWEEPVPTIMTAAQPPLLFDYYGFPPETYKLTWPAPGDARLAARVGELLAAAGFPTAVNAERGYDHGTFVPLKVMYPEADMKVVQLSLKKGLDPAEHLAMGRALAPLRDEGVFIVGSGMSFHNMRGFNASGRAPSEAFDAWLGETVALDEPTRSERLAQWSTAPAARQSHPREEHLLPLMVIAGAAGPDRGRTGFSGTVMGPRVSGYHFG